MNVERYQGPIFLLASPCNDLIRRPTQGLFQDRKDIMPGLT
jgi:hypothetical protein